MIYTVVFDTNILISAALSKGGSPNSCFSLAQSKLIRSVTCPEILQELSEKLLLKITVRKYIEEICEASTIVSIGGTLRAVPNDPDDDMIIECAIAGKATHIITGDKHLLSLVEYQNIQIVKAKDFLDFLT
ncbi:MAG: putative toxin-antitoxin system toxin component, PIN family, partial [Microcystis aeruginosa]